MIDVVARIQQAPGAAPLDLIFVVGDIAYSGKPKEYHKAKDFFDKLISAAQIRKEQLFMVPGNHDVDRSTGRWLLRGLTDAEQSHGFFTDLMDDKERAFHLRKFAAFHEFHDDYFKCCDARYLLKNSKGSCADVITVDVRGTKIAVLRVNSAIFAQDDEDERVKMWIGHPCVDRAVTQLPEDAIFRIALMHHPIGSMHQEDQGYPELCRAVDFVLTGHTHQQATELVIDEISGSKVLRCNSGSVFSSYRQRNSIVRVVADLKQVQMFTYSYVKERAVWEVDSSMHGGLSKNIDIRVLDLAGSDSVWDAVNAAVSYEGIDLATLRAGMVQGSAGEALISELVGVPRAEVKKVIAQASRQTLAEAFGTKWPGHEVLGRFTAAKATRLGLYGVIAGVVSRSRNKEMSWQEVKELLDGQHGKTHVRTIFSDWPGASSFEKDDDDTEIDPLEFEAIGHMTASQARQQGLEECISRITGLKVGTVKGHLGRVHGKSLVTNIFQNWWPSKDQLMDYTVAEIMRCSLVGDLALSLECDPGQLYGQMCNIHGKTLVKNLVKALG